MEQHPTFKNKTMSPELPQRSPMSKLADLLYRNGVLIAMIVVCGLWIWQSLTPQELFATEEERRQVLLSVGAEPSTRLITLGTEWCPACKQLDLELNERGIRHLRLDVEKDPAGEALFRKVYAATGSNSIPKIILDRNIVSRPTLFLELSRGKIE